MPYDANGMWKPEDDKVDAEVARITTNEANSPLLKRARFTGLAQGQQRGLLNSTMAAQAGEAAVLDKALPMAQQNAQATTAKNLQGQAFAENTGLNQQKFGFDTALQGQQIAGQKDIQQVDVTSREKISGQQIASNEKVAAADQTAQMERLNTQIEGQKGLQQMQGQNQLVIANLDAASRERIQGMTLAANDKEKVATLIQQADASYNATLATIAQNENIPADVRDRYIASAGAVRDSTLNLLEQVYGVNLTWASPSTTGTTTPGTVTLPGGQTLTAPAGWNAAGYLANNTDIAGSFNTLSSGGGTAAERAWWNGVPADARASPEAFALWHYTTSGQAEGRSFTAPPTTGTSPPPPPPPATINTSALGNLRQGTLANGQIDPNQGKTQTEWNAIRRQQGFTDAFPNEGGQQGAFENWIDQQPRAKQIEYINQLIGGGYDPDYIDLRISKLPAS